MLRGQKVRLTAITENDLPTLASWYEDTDLRRLFDATPAFPRSPRELGRWLEERQARPDGHLFAIRPVDGAGMVGCLELDGILWSHRNAWLSILLGDRSSWGRGWASEAMRLVMAFAFDELNLHRLQLTVFADNERALRLYDRLGFVREGAYREFLLRDGKAQDMLLFGLLRREWAAEATVPDPAR